jgi:hypothetical protein
MMDFLQLIQKRLLRMDPTNRAECDEIVETLMTLEKRCSTDRQYCMRKQKRPPDRSDAEVSLLKPASLDFTPEMGNLLKRMQLPLYNDPVESGAGPSGGQSSVTTSGKNSPGNYVLSERTRHEPDGIESLAEPRTQELADHAAVISPRQPTINEATPSSSSYVDPLSSRAASAFRKIHFAPGRAKDRISSMPDLHDIQELQAEAGPSTISGTGHGVSENSTRPPPLAVHPNSSTRKLSNRTIEGAQSSITSVPAWSTSSKHELPSEQRPAAGISLRDSSTHDQQVENSIPLEIQTPPGAAFHISDGFSRPREVRISQLGLLRSRSLGLRKLTDEGGVKRRIPLLVDLSTDIDCTAVEWVVTQLQQQEPDIDHVPKGLARHCAVLWKFQCIPDPFTRRARSIPLWSGSGSISSTDQPSSITSPSTTPSRALRSWQGKNKYQTCRQLITIAIVLGVREVLEEEIKTAIWGTNKVIEDIVPLQLNIEGIYMVFYMETLAKF